MIGSSSRRRSADRGVSEVVGFVLMFSIIIASVGLVATFGFQQLEENRADQELRNAERVMQLVERDYDALQQGEATVRSNEIDASRGSVLFSDDGSIGVFVENSNGATFTDTYQMGTIRYEVDDTSVAYQGGMVGRASSGQSQRAITPPSIRCSPSQNAAIVSLVTLDTPDRQVSSTVRIVGRTNGTDIIYPRDRPGTGGGQGPRIDGITLFVTSEYGDAWRSALLDSGWSNPSPGEFTCPSADRAYVRRTVVDLKVIS